MFTFVKKIHVVFFFNKRYLELAFLFFPCSNPKELVGLSVSLIYFGNHVLIIDEIIVELRNL